MYNAELSVVVVPESIDGKIVTAISFDALEGCAKEIVAKCKEAGVTLTDAGATFPYGKDPKDSNIRIAPSYPEMDELIEACKIFILCVKLVSVKKLLGE